MSSLILMKFYRGAGCLCVGFAENFYTSLVHGDAASPVYLRFNSL